MPSKYIILYDIFGSFVTVSSDFPESGPPVGHPEKKDVLNGDKCTAISCWQHGLVVSDAFLLKNKKMERCNFSEVIFTFIVICSSLNGMFE